MKPNHTLKLYQHPLSGHSHRVHLALSLLGLPYELIDVDLMKAAHKRPEFLALNPFGQVPVLDDDGTILFDSNAILVYLATTYDADRRWLPRDAKQQAAVQAWLSVAAGLVAFGPAAARLITVFGAKFNPEDVIGRAHVLLKVMEGQLATRAFLAGPEATIADIAATATSRQRPKATSTWRPTRRCAPGWPALKALPGFVPFKHTAVGLAA
jgi:glutathione S-transferase